jgi:hypothetical protein
MRQNMEPRTDFAVVYDWADGRDGGKEGFSYI